MNNAIALGTFDGIHTAHKAVLNLPDRYNKICVTFLKPPKMEMNGNTELIMTFEDKCKSLKELGFAEIKALDFSAVKDIEVTQFLQYLYEEYNPKYISCGFDYRFGKGGKGDVHVLSDFCKQKGIELNVCKEMLSDGTTLSSTKIREMLKNGETQKANSLLLKPFSFSAEVIKGKSLGRKIGFPTINQKYPQELVKVKFGVYKTRVLFDGKVYAGITNIGVKPTVKSDYVISETYINDFSGDIYGKTVKIELLKFLREEKKFSSIDDLKEQIAIDIKTP